MVSAWVAVGLLVAVFVGINIGGSPIGVAFGQAVGSRLVGKAFSAAAALFTVFAFLGAWTVGRNVIVTMSDGIVPAAQFSPVAGVGVLFFTGLALLLSNLYGVPASTSMTAVGAIVGLGLATNTLNEALMFTIVSAWVVAPLTGFVLGAIVGDTCTPSSTRGSRSRDSNGRSYGSSARVVCRGCGSTPASPRATSSGRSSCSGLPATWSSARGLERGQRGRPARRERRSQYRRGCAPRGRRHQSRGFTIARRTLATVGEDITDLPILAALVVSTVGATIITVLSYLGIPASLAVSTTCCIIGLGWGGRAVPSHSPNSRPRPATSRT